MYVLKYINNLVQHPVFSMRSMFVVVAQNSCAFFYKALCCVSLSHSCEQVRLETWWNQEARSYENPVFVLSPYLC